MVNGRVVARRIACKVNIHFVCSLSVDVNDLCDRELRWCDGLRFVVIGVDRAPSAASRCDNGREEARRLVHLLQRQPICVYVAIVTALAKLSSTASAPLDRDDRDVDVALKQQVVS